jgi:chemotaxis methyl-accepting protein methylase
VTELDEAGFAQLARVIAAGIGIGLDSYKDRCLRRRIAVRMRACGLHTYRDYAAYLARAPEEFERLRDTLTINVTRFYRNPETWDCLRRDVLPGLLRSTGGHVRVWSAGCASGEEPYTIAMLLAEAAAGLGRTGWLAHVAIDATDVDRTSLARTRAARYADAAMAELPPDLLTRWFRRDGDAWVVSETLRRLVTVHALDLGRDPPPRPAYELICCRNVVIYFGRAVQERIFARFTDALVPGGYLVLGKVETLVGPARDRLRLIEPRERIYQRAA